MHRPPYPEETKASIPHKKGWPKQSEKLRNLKKGLIKALGNLGNTDSLKLLIKFLDIDDFELRKTAESALEQIHPKWKTKVNEDLSNRSF